MRSVGTTQHNARVNADASTVRVPGTGNFSERLTSPSYRRDRLAVDLARSRVLLERIPSST